MDELLKGNYKVKTEVPVGDIKEKNEQAALESLFEASALEKLGGSICFVKKSSSFVWKGK